VGVTQDAGTAQVRIFLARHGRTALNARGVLRGRLDPPLDPVGRREALRLGALLASLGADDVVSSPLRRAVETAKAVASMVGVEVSVDASLADRDYGCWAGRTAEEIERRWGSVDEAPGVEPLGEVRARALEALEEARRRCRSRAVLVSHDVVNRTILAAVDPGIGGVGAIPQRTGCFNVLDWSGGQWTVVAVDQVPPETATRAHA
jgi:broad specificity phosphatase PhoE